MKTVFFGPFIGELGWEMLFWQGWVRKVCREDFRDYRKIAASRPGREPFYTDVDEFWSLPDDFLKRAVSGHGYITDGWRSGFPGKQEKMEVGLGLGERLGGRWLRSLLSPVLPLPLEQVVFGRRARWRERALPGPDIEPYAEGMLIDFQERLPPDARLFVPWRMNEHAGVRFGTEALTETDGTPRFKAVALEYTVQSFEPLRATSAGRAALAAYVAPDQKLIAVFPRRRVLRRADKNWPREKYEELVHRLQASYPVCRVAIVGEPGGAYFVEGVPAGCLDLINVPAERRFDIQIGALRQCVAATGAISGALSVAMATGCPTLIWGYEEVAEIYRQSNVLGTPMIYLPTMDPEVSTVTDSMQRLLALAGSHPGNGVPGAGARAPA